ncbi:MAG: TIGR04086 family membrane protein [Ruminococcaceae bacterium]|nr:TIGR04086 family membrane protein [Oscillospiraceae bacterium]
MKKSEKNNRNFWLSCLLSQITWATATIVLMLIFCGIAYSTADPDSLTVPLSLCALYLSAVIGGIAAVKISGDGIASGCISGCITTGIVFCLSLLPFPDSTLDIPLSIILILMIIPASIVGSVIGHKKEKKPKKLNHHRR